MTDTIRCPACRGAKKVPKLGGMIGACNACTGKGTILAADKPKPVITVEDVCAKELINAVADCVPASDISNHGKLDIKSVPLCAPSATVLEQDVKIDGKKALYKRKKA